MSAPLKMPIQSIESSSEDLAVDQTGGAEQVLLKPRERILAAALKLFVDQGYFNTNVPDLSRESRCSIGSIYHTFKSKEEIARALYADGISAFRDAMYASLSELPSESNKTESTKSGPTNSESCSQVEGIVKSVVKSFLKFSETHHQLSRYIWLCRHNEFLNGIIKQPTTVGFDKLGRLLSKSLKLSIRSGDVRDIKAPIIWSILFGVPLAYIRDWLDGYNSEPPSAVADEIAEACWRALRLKEPKK